MYYTYVINKVLPKAEFMAVTYSADGFPDYRRNFNPTDFSQEAISALIESFAPRVVEFWERQASHPEEVTLSGGSGTAEINSSPPKPPTVEPTPEYDFFTQRVELNEITDPAQETVGWTIYDLTEEEKAEVLVNWRRGAFVTMRQARLALAQQGLLQTVEDAIALIPEPDRSKISVEWEYSAIVERGSSWIGVLAPALGLSDEQMDDLFKLAATL